MKKILSFAVILLLSISAFTQSKNLTLKDCIYANGNIFPKMYRSLQWIPETNNLSYIDNDTLYHLTLQGKTKLILSFESLKTAVSNSEYSDKISFYSMPSIRWIDKNTFIFVAGKAKYTYNIKNNKIIYIRSIPEGENIDPNNKKDNYAFTRGNDLYITKGEDEVCIAKSEKDGILYGSDRVHRNEFGIKKGTFWSPQDNYLAFYRMDESMVTDYPLVDINTRIAETENIKYPMAGMTSHHVTLGVYNIKTGKTVYIKTGEPVDQFLTSISWDPSEEYIYIGILNRGQNHLKMNKYDVVTGDFVKTLFEEKDDKYVEPENPMFFESKDKSKFLWMSERDGWNHLYLYDTEGQLIKQITKGPWTVTSIIGFNDKEDILYITSTEGDPLQNNIFAVDIKSGNTTRLSNAIGTHSAIFSDDMRYFIDIYSNTEVVRDIDLVDNKGNTITNILHNQDPLKDYRQCNIQIGKLKSDAGDDLYYRIITPPDFNPNKKYPVFFYVYGGPHLQMVTNSWNGGASFWDLRWAQRGYIVFSMDNRGTPNRGLAFEQAIHRNLGVLEVADQMKGVEYLKSLPYVDSEKMAVDGWSYGGFMTISLMLKSPNTFAVGVAGGPVIDWQYYEIMYGERYMDTPEENPDGYENACLLNYVENLEGKLMLIHCTTDPVVVWQHSLRFIDKCIKEGKQVDYFVYPGHEHNVRGYDRMHLYEKIENYIDEALLLKK